MTGVEVGSAYKKLFRVAQWWQHAAVCATKGCSIPRNLGVVFAAVANGTVLSRTSGSIRALLVTSDKMAQHVDLDRSCYIVAQRPRLRLLADTARRRWFAVLTMTYASRFAEHTELNTLHLRSPRTHSNYGLS
jgi:hypothetical protein